MVKSMLVDGLMVRDMYGGGNTLVNSMGTVTKDMVQSAKERTEFRYAENSGATHQCTIFPADLAFAEFTSGLYLGQYAASSTVNNISAYRSI